MLISYVKQKMKNEYHRAASSWKILENPGRPWKKKHVIESPGKTKILAKVLEKPLRVMVKYFVCLSSGS